MSRLFDFRFIGVRRRHVLFAGTVRLFGQTVVSIRVWHVNRSMPLRVGFGLVSLFIWLAENIGTGTRVWLYPNQTAGWSPVPAAKLGSQFLPVLVSDVLVTLVSQPEPMPAASAADAEASPRLGSPVS